jgi:hypothetical protein
MAPLLPNLLAAALAYAELGYRVFPCAPGTKVPLTTHGFQDASSDVEQIERWWGQSPNANIAMPTQGLLVVDVDGAENPFLEEAPEQLLELGSTAVSCTPHGGRQFLFRQPPGVPLRNTSGRLAAKVDTRADGGYIVLPPSVLEEGKCYRWQPTCELEVGPERLPEVPPWLLARLEAVERQVSLAPAGEGNAIPEGQRNHALARLGGAMRRQGMTQAEILAALSVTNATRCRPPLPEREVERVATSVARYEPDQISTALAEGHWEQMQQGAEPALRPRSLRELIQQYPQLRDPVIHGLLRQGETMNLISAPKVGKSWLVNALALCLATGRPWLDTFQTERRKVLVLDNELHPETLAQRIPKVAAAMGIPQDAYADRVDVLSLRGQLKDVFGLGPLLDSFAPGEYGAIICDAFYRFMPAGMDENDNGTMANLYNHIDRFADRLGAAFILIHHSSKGNQSLKSITDVGAGAGSQSRAVDAHLVLRPHEEEDTVVLEAAVRSWPPVDAMCLRWAFPVFSPAPDLDPKQLRVEKSRRRVDRSADALPEQDVEQFVQTFVRTEPQTRAAVLRAGTTSGLSNRRALQLLHWAEDMGLVFRWNYGSHRPTCYATVPKPERSGHAT